MSTLTITCIQSDISWQDKPENLRRFGSRIALLKGKTELVILPEMFNTGFCTEPEGLAEKMNGETVSWMKSMAYDHKLILTGSLIIEDQGRFYNRLIWALPDGRLGYYDKRHLFAFAGEDQKFSAGSKRLIASVNGWRINLQVCYDLRFPVWARHSAAPGGEKEPEYDLLIYVANWPLKRIHAWKTLLQARAIENQAYVAGLNRVGTDANGLQYSGDSMIIDPLGEPLYHAGDQEDVFTCVLQKKDLSAARTKFPFWRDRDQFFIEP